MRPLFFRPELLFTFAFAFARRFFAFFGDFFCFFRDLFCCFFCCFFCFLGFCHHPLLKLGLINYFLFCSVFFIEPFFTLLLRHPERIMIATMAGIRSINLTFFAVTIWFSSFFVALIWFWCSYLYQY